MGLNKIWRIEKMNRLKVAIRCNQCGEKYILRGKMDSSGRIKTGFKKCICDNESNLEIETEYI